MKPSLILLGLSVIWWLLIACCLWVQARRGRFYKSLKRDVIDGFPIFVFGTIPSLSMFGASVVLAVIHFCERWQ